MALRHHLGADNDVDPPGQDVGDQRLRQQRRGQGIGGGERDPRLWKEPLRLLDHSLHPRPARRPLAAAARGTSRRQRHRMPAVMAMMSLQTAMLDQPG